MTIGIKIPLRISLAGGGTDLEPYVSDRNGHVVNFGIDKYIRISVSNVGLNNGIKLSNLSKKTDFIFSEKLFVETVNSDFRIPIAVIHVFRQAFPDVLVNDIKIEFESDVQAGSGLGASSILAAGIIMALAKFYNLHLMDKEVVGLAKLAESGLLKLRGGEQDYWSACDPRLKSLSFGSDGYVRITPINLRSNDIEFLESSLFLVSTKISRISGEIIEDQMNTMNENKKDSYDFLDLLKNSAIECEKLLINGNFRSELGQILNLSWDIKKQLSKKVSDSNLDYLRELVLKCGAKGVKICGAGGGGYFLAYCPENSLNFKQKLKAEKINFEGIRFFEYN